MAQQRLHSALAPIDVLTREELEESLGKGFDQAERARVRGVDYMEVNGNAAAASIVTIPGPNSGYAWSVKIVSAVATAVGTVTVYSGENTNSAPIASMDLAVAGAAIFRFTSNIVVIRDNRAITIAASAGGINQWKVLAKQVPDEMIGKL